MVTLTVSLPDDIVEALQVRAHEAAVDEAEYLRTLLLGLLEADHHVVSPELGAALDDGEASGFIPYAFSSIIADARAKSRIG